MAQHNIERYCSAGHSIFQQESEKNYAYQETHVALSIHLPLAPKNFLPIFSF